MIIGERQGKQRKEYVIASENALFTSLGFKTLRNVLPGEAIFIDNDGNLHSQQCFDKVQNHPVFLNMFTLQDPTPLLMKFQCINPECEWD